MFKLYEKDIKVTKRVDMTYPLLDNIVPGSILIDGENGVRVAGAGDHLTFDTAGLMYIATDYLANSMMATINGLKVMNTGFITCVPICEKAKVQIPVSTPIANGDRLTIYNGQLVKFAEGIPDELLVLGVGKTFDEYGYVLPYGVIEMFTDGITVAVTDAPRIGYAGIIDVGMEDPRLSVMILGNSAQWDSDGAEINGNWVIGGGDEHSLTLDAVVCTPELPSYVELFFTGTATSGTLTIQAKKEAFQHPEGHDSNVITKEIEEYTHVFYQAPLHAAYYDGGELRIIHNDEEWTIFDILGTGVDNNAILAYKEGKTFEGEVEGNEVDAYIEPYNPSADGAVDGDIDIDEITGAISFIPDNGYGDRLINAVAGCTMILSWDDNGTPMETTYTIVSVTEAGGDVTAIELGAPIGTPMPDSTPCTAGVISYTSTGTYIKSKNEQM